MKSEDNNKNKKEEGLEIRDLPLPDKSDWRPPTTHHLSKCPICSTQLSKIEAELEKVEIRKLKEEEERRI